MMIFRDKPALLRLYNAVRGSYNTNLDDLIDITIENVLYLGMKNDVSFIINVEHNQKLMEACRELYENSYLVEQIRIGVNSGPALAYAVDRAVADCIEHDVLKDFLLRHRAKVTNVILEKFDLNKHIKSEKELSYAEGDEAERKRFSEFLNKLINRLD